MTTYTTGQKRSHRDPAAAAEARDQALDKVATHNDLGLFTEAIEALAKSVPAFTGDDVWAWLGDNGEQIREPRALGAAMRSALSRGLIAPTDRFVASTRPARHAGPVRVWQPA